MTRTAALLIPMLVLGSQAQAQEINFRFECEVTGTRMDGSASTKPYKERFVYERKEMKDKDAPKNKPWVISKSELVSDNIKYDQTRATAGDGYLVFNTIAKTGSGFNQKLLIITHYIDISSAEIERIVTRIPKDAEERTRGRCKKLN